MVHFVCIKFQRYFPELDSMFGRFLQSLLLWVGEIYIFSEFEARVCRHELLLAFLFPCNHACEVRYQPMCVSMCQTTWTGLQKCVCVLIYGSIVSSILTVCRVTLQMARKKHYNYCILPVAAQKPFFAILYIPSCIAPYLTFIRIYACIKYIKLANSDMYGISLSASTSHSNNSISLAHSQLCRVCWVHTAIQQTRPALAWFCFLAYFAFCFGGKNTQPIFISM